MPLILAAWVVLTALACVVAYARASIELSPMPGAEAQRWALAALRAGCEGLALPEPPAAARSHRSGGVVAHGWLGGRSRMSQQGAQLVPAVQAAARHFAAERAGQALRCSALRFTLSVDRGRAPLVRGVPLLRAFSVVPLVEGVTAELDGKRAHVTPDELIAAGLHDHVKTPIPDLAFGLDLDGALRLLAARHGVTRAQLLARAHVERYRAGSVTDAPYPAEVRPDVATLRRAAREGAEFLLRHMQPDGRYTYVYFGGTGERSPPHQYSMPRHAGTTYFLAQADRLLDMPEARQGALEALRYVARERLRQCGAPERLCIENGGRGDMGASALTAVAAAEVLLRGEDRLARRLLVGLTEFIRSMQRKDGELMHVYDFERDRPLDVQLMYYSGEAAYALLRSHAVLDDARNLGAARRLMRHLTGAGWSFFGSRYFYGEEHWTCQAVSQAARIFELPAHDAGVDFCRRWLAFQRVLQYGKAQTPWSVDGAIGVGPLLLPRVTTVSSRTETAAMLYPVFHARGLDVDEVRRQVEASLGFLLRAHWSPGPAHLLADPPASRGGMPGSPASLDVRNDFVQHAGSAFLLWLEALDEVRTRAPKAPAR